MEDYRVPKEHQFQPYAFNGGSVSVLPLVQICYELLTCRASFSSRPHSLHAPRPVNPNRTILAIAGDNFAVIASDTRLSEGFMIHSRDTPKTYKL